MRLADPYLPSMDALWDHLERSKYFHSLKVLATSFPQTFCSQLPLLFLRVPGQPVKPLVIMNSCGPAPLAIPLSWQTVSSAAWSSTYWGFPSSAPLSRLRMPQTLLCSLAFGAG